MRFQLLLISSIDMFVSTFWEQVVMTMMDVVNVIYYRQPLCFYHGTVAILS